MTDNKTNTKKLLPEDRAALIKKMNDNLEIISLQAEIAEARARIKKANLEEIVYSLKLSELETPKEQNLEKKDGENGKD